jgi:small subunit ribosomal protein S4
MRDGSAAVPAGSAWSDRAARWQIYGVLERQFRHHFDEVRKKRGVTGEQLLSRLERRLDNTVYRLGFAASRSQAKELVSHKFFEVNGKRVDIPSYEVKVGDVIKLKTTKKEKTFVKMREETLLNKKDVPAWLELDAANLAGTVIGLPSRGDVGIVVDPQMVVEYYSK